jgi:hypothetical protein
MLQKPAGMQTPSPSRRRSASFRTWDVNAAWAAVEDLFPITEGFTAPAYVPAQVVGGITYKVRSPTNRANQPTAPLLSVGRQLFTEHKYAYTHAAAAAGFTLCTPAGKFSSAAASTTFLTPAGDYAASVAADTAILTPTGNYASAAADIALFMPTGSLSCYHLHLSFIIFSRESFHIRVQPLCHVDILLSTEGPSSTSTAFAEAMMPHIIDTFSPLPLSQANSLRQTVNSTPHLTFPHPCLCLQSAHYHLNFVK